MASVNPSEIFIYGSANMPEANGVTIGGAVDTTKKISFTDLTIPGKVNYVSSNGADTTTRVTLTGRDVTGAIVSESIVLNNPATNPVAGTQTFERLLYAAISGATAGGPLPDPGGTNAAGDVAILSNSPLIVNHTVVSYTPTAGAVPPLIQLQAGDGATCVVGTIIRAVSDPGANQLCYVIDNTRYGTDVVAINRNLGTGFTGSTLYSAYQGMFFDSAPNPVRAVIRAFATSNANASGTDPTLTYYEKVFVLNNDTTTSLTSAVVTLQSENAALPGSSSLQIGLTATLNDTATVVNRNTAPGGVTFTTGAPPQSQPVPSAGNLPSGAPPNANGAQAVWLRLTLPGGTSPYKGIADLRVTGVTS